MKRLVARAPYGWQLAGTGLAPEPREQAALAIVRDGRARGASYERIAEELRAQGYTTRTGRPMGAATVWTIWRAATPQEARAA